MNKQAQYCNPLYFCIQNIFRFEWLDIFATLDFRVLLCFGNATQYIHEISLNIVYFK